MDDFFDRLKGHAGTAKDGAVKIGRQVYAKTNNMLSQTKLNFSISDSENKVKDIYQKIGQNVYENYIKDGCVEEAYYDDCARIDELLAEIENMRGKIAELKNSVKCKKCGEYNKENARYCSKCGEALTDAYEEESDIVEEKIVDFVEAEPVSAAEDVAEAVSEASEDVKEAVSEAADDAEKTVKRVVTIKARRPHEAE